MLSSDDLFLTQAEALRIVMAVDPAKKVSTEALIVGVHNAAVNYVFGRDNPHVSADERVADAEALAKSCRDVLVNLGIAPTGRSKDKAARKPVEFRSIRRSLGAGALYTAGPAVLDAIRAVQELERWADNIAKHYEAKGGNAKAPGKRGAPSNRALLGSLFAELEGIYFGLWDDLPSLTREYDGDLIPHERTPIRFLRFLCEVLPLLAQRGVEGLPRARPGKCVSVAIEQAVRRWRNAQDTSEMETSLYVTARRLASEFKGG